MKAGRIVWVSWVDSQGCGGWRHGDEALKWSKRGRLKCWSCGLLLRDGKKSLTLGLNRSKEGQWDSLMKIPKVAIKKMCKLERPGKGAPSAKKKSA